jgi:osmotically inducible lipoprotein OsmB
MFGVSPPTVSRKRLAVGWALGRRRVSLPSAAPPYCLYHAMLCQPPARRGVARKRGMIMKSMAVLSILVLLAGCGYSPGTRAVTGGLMGAGAGAGVSAVTGGKPATGALIGGGVGAAGGALTAP